MNKITRQQFLDRLQNNWRDYPGRFHRLSPQAQKEFLTKQGYANLSGLFGHVVAWWQAGVEVVLFKARAVEKFGSLDESEVAGVYEAQRQAMVDLLSGLSDAELESERINTRLYYEIIMHWEEHPLE